MRLLISVLAVSLAIGVTSCGGGRCGGGPSNETVQKMGQDFVGTIKKDLEAIAESGRVGSGYSVLVSDVIALANKEPDKAGSDQESSYRNACHQGSTKYKRESKRNHQNAVAEVSF